MTLYCDQSTKPIFQDAFDASYLNYLLDWWDHVCPQPGMGATGFENPLLAQWAAQNPERGLPTGPTLGTEDCLHLAVFTPEVNIANNVHGSYNDLF